ncbi:MAG TPA: hypothetical protein VG797_10240 [Phycisphaerales bacterium]|nr:hypothetical protein [Phycisphaerales bacterium]
MNDPAHSPGASSPATPRRSWNPVRAILELFSSVRLGIILLFILFIYCTIGSAGILYPVAWNIFDTENWRHEFVRTWRAFEMTEFEWFHTPFFTALIGLIAANIFITTIRRIPLTVLSIGVWTIHAGIIILCIGSVIYFGTKVEGDAPVIRRAVTINFPDHPPVTIAAMPGASAEVRTDAGAYFFQVSQVQPDWPLMSEPDKGKKAYSVSVFIRSPKRQFIRQLLDGFPQYTEDIIPGMGRAVKQPDIGVPIVDDSFTLGLAPFPQDRFWVMNSAALCVRDTGTSEWTERPIRGLPRYNDYLSSPGDAWSDEPLPVLPLNIPLGAATGKEEKADPLGEAQVRVIGFLRYAEARSSFAPGGSFNPMAEVTLTGGGTTADFRLLALDEKEKSALKGELELRLVDRESDVQAAGTPQPHKLTIRVPRLSDEYPGGEVTASFTRADLIRSQQSPPPPEFAGDTPSLMRAGVPFAPIPGSPFEFRVRQVVDRLQLSEGQAPTVAIVEFRYQEPGTEDWTTFQRWIFEDPTRNRDMPIATEEKPNDPHTTREPDARLVTVFEPKPQPTVLLIAARDTGRLAAFALDDLGDPHRFDLAAGAPTEVRPGLTLTLKSYVPDAQRVTKPFIVPRERRDRDIDTAQLGNLVQIEITDRGESRRLWLPFHAYAVESDALAAANMGRYSPTEITLASGRRVELMFSRESRRLPAPVILDDFILTSQVGGYTGITSSIRDWTSVIRFRDGDQLSEPSRVSSNNPAEHLGYWFFQKTWDPNGLRYTGLGIGNREGVYTQLAGCATAVAGMIYAFYVKPIIRRRRIAAVHATVAAQRAVTERDVLLGGVPTPADNDDILASSTEVRR